MKATTKLLALKNLKREKLAKEKKLKGFTLVELIVVIAIIGVLAVLLVPNMLGKVQDAKLKTAQDAAAKIAEQTKIAVAELDAAGTAYGDTISVATVTESKGGVTDANQNLYKAVKAAVTELESKYKKCEIKIGTDGSVAVRCAENDKTQYVGLYPAPANYDAKSTKGKDYGDWEIKTDATSGAVSIAAKTATDPTPAPTEG